ncbi:MAG: hypothetical protein R3C59_19310 [Planctomycetaceae bacterium]
MITPSTLPSSLLFLLPFVCMATNVSATAQEWTTLTGQFVVSGDVAQPEKLEITRDEEFCGQHGLVDESLLVNPDSHGLQNVVIWLSSKTDVPVHPSRQAAPKPVQLDNKDCRFVPRIVMLRTNQVLQSTNADPVVHNVAVYARRNQPFSIVVPEDKPLERSFAKSELLPIRVDCSIHAWMRAYLVITDHPYAAVTDQDGRFSIADVPQGTWEFRTWHERPGYLPEVTLDGKRTELNRGTLELTLSTPEHDLGRVTITAAQLAAD